MSKQSQLVERFRRWCHCLRWMFSGHLGVTAYSRTNRTVLIACSCGVVFWELDPRITAFWNIAEQEKKR